MSRDESMIGRRDFLRGASTVGAAIAASPLLGASRPAIEPASGITALSAEQVENLVAAGCAKERLLLVKVSVPSTLQQAAIEKVSGKEFVAVMISKRPVSDTPVPLAPPPSAFAMPTRRASLNSPSLASAPLFAKNILPPGSPPKCPTRRSANRPCCSVR